MTDTETIETLRATVAHLTAERDALRAALQTLYDETADYIRVNHLGDTHHNKSMRDARAALAPTQKEAL